MKKFLAIAFLSFILVGLGNTPILAIRSVNRFDEQTQPISNDSQIIIEEPKEELYKNLFITLIYPHVEKAIDDYYDEYMTYLPGEDPWFYKFLSIEKTQGLNYSYIIKLEVQPYVGPHLSVGIDHITLKIELGNVKVEKYEHLKSYELPPHYQDIIKKKLPNT
jgi:hypothetical protein